MKKSKGFSLIEVVITVLIVTIAFVALTKGYLTIGRGLILTQNKTIAVNIAHEKVETLKKLTYPRLYVTTSTAEDQDYDTVYYPPVTYNIKKTDFIRYVTVRKVRENPDGNIEELLATDPDEGLKRIKVEVKWTETPSPRDAAHVETFLNLHGEYGNRGYVVCRCSRRQQLTDKVTAIPWNEF